MIYGKNAEGYSDPTMTTAVANIARSEKTTAKRRPITYVTADYPIVYVASAYRGDVNTNVEKAKEYSRFVLSQGAVPFTPHLLYTQFLDDASPKERKEGLFCGKVMLGKCDLLWAFGDISDGMLGEIEEAHKLGIPIRYFNAECGEVTG